MRKAFALLSGGMDSTTCLHQAILDYKPSNISEHDIFEFMDNGSSPSFDKIDWVEAISIFYGQRHKKEMEFAKKTCDKLGIKHSILDIGDVLSGKMVMLTDASRADVEVPNMSYDEIKGVSPTYVPFRNGTMLSCITAYAQKWVNEQNKIHDAMIEKINLEGIGCDIDPKPSAGIYFGAHAEDAHNWAYPDCTPEFIGAMANAIYIGSYMQIRLHTPIQWSSKAQVVALGETLSVRWEDTWSCYKGDEHHCGTCPTCRARKGAFQAAGVADPTEYAA